MIAVCLLLSSAIPTPTFGRHTTPIRWIPFDRAPESLRTSSAGNSTFDDDGRFVGGYLIVSLPNDTPPWEPEFRWRGGGTGFRRESPGLVKPAVDHVQPLLYPSSPRESHRVLEIMRYRLINHRDLRTVNESVTVEFPFDRNRLAARYRPVSRRFGKYLAEATFIAWQPEGVRVKLKVKRTDGVTLPTSYERGGGELPTVLANGDIVVFGDLETQRKLGQLDTGDYLTRGPKVFRDIMPFSLTLKPRL